VVGSSVVANGVEGSSRDGFGVLGTSENSNGVWGGSTRAEGVRGHGKTGVYGFSTSNGYGVSGFTESDYQPCAKMMAGVWGDNDGSGAAVKGTSLSGDGVIGYSTAPNHAGVAAVNNNNEGTTTAYRSPKPETQAPEIVRDRI
jgi:hypothetical protein